MRLLNKFFYLIILLLSLLVVTQCSQDLSVTNENAPDKDRALANPSDVEGLIAGSGLTYWNQTHQQEPSMTLSVMADEMSSSWGNFAMRDMSSEPREAWNNFMTYDADYRRVNELAWYGCYSALSAASDGLREIEAGMFIYAADSTDNTPRAKAFAKFMQGVSLGFVALFYDQGFLLDETVDVSTGELALQPYTVLMPAAIQMLNDCISICEANSFTLPDNWINGVAMTNTELAQVAHSYAARYIASVARSPEDRAAADWATILNHINHGITEDYAVQGDGNFWWYGLHMEGMNDIWVRTDYKCIGPADTSGNYQAWLNTPVQDRDLFLIYTADQRVTALGDPQSDGTDFAYYGQPYHRPDRGTYHFSYYANYRYFDHLANNGVGPMMEIMVAEMNLLKAEALLRLYNDGQGTVDLINITRVGRGQLPPATAENIGSVSDPRAVFGSVWAMLKYEKGIECFAGGLGLAFWDRRGWGELVSGTALHFPIPAQEIEVLQMETYTFGGSAGGAAPKQLPKLSFLKTYKYY